MRNRNEHKPAMAGFTLIEMMLAMAVAALLITAAAPAFRTQVLKSRMTGATNDLVGTLAGARSASVGRSDFVTVCKRNSDGTACLTTGGWEQGWLTFVDSDNDGVIDGGEDIIHIHDPLATGLTARSTALAASRVTFRPNGLTNLASTQTLVLCDERGFGEDARAIVITILGKARSMPSTDTAQVSCLTS